MKLAFKTIRVLVVDNHPIVRDGLREVFAKHPQIRMEGAAANGQEALDILLQKEIDVMILDISMPGASWLDIIRKARGIRPKLPVLIFSMHNEQEYITRSLQAGAAGYLTKESAGSVIVQAVEKVASGGKYFSPEASEKLADYVQRGGPPHRHESLSEREFQIMLLLARGCKPSEIARLLFLSVNTVNTYKARILKKIKADSLAELIRYAIKTGLLD